MSEYILDASAVLAYLNAEEGWERVEPMLIDHRCHLLTVNLAEVLTRLADWSMPLDQVEARIEGMEIDIVDFDRALARQAAELRAATRHAGLSLGDRACLALAKSRGLPAVTADRPWIQVEQALGIEILCIRGETGNPNPVT